MKPKNHIGASTEKVAEPTSEYDYSKTQEIACPDCYGGHFRPCQMCGDSGRVTFTPYKTGHEKGKL